MPRAGSYSDGSCLQSAGFSSVMETCVLSSTSKCVSALQAAESEATFLP